MWYTTILSGLILNSSGVSTIEIQGFWLEENKLLSVELTLKRSFQQFLKDKLLMEMFSLVYNSPIWYTIKSEVKGELDDMKSILDNMERKMFDTKHQDNDSRLRFVIKN